MDSKSAKLLLSGILNNDDAVVERVISAAFEASMREKLATETRSLMESIGMPSKDSNLLDD